MRCHCRYLTKSELAFIVWYFTFHFTWWRSRALKPCESFNTQGVTQNMSWSLSISIWIVCHRLYYFSLYVVNSDHFRKDSLRFMLPWLAINPGLFCFLQVNNTPLLFSGGLDQARSEEMCLIIQRNFTMNPYYWMPMVTWSVTFLSCLRTKPGICVQSTCSSLNR